MSNSDWLARSRAAVWHPCTQMKRHETLPITPVARGDGIWLEDFDGHRFIDAVSSWWVNLFGHGHPRIQAALADQLARLDHVMLAGFTHAPVVELSERLAALTGLGHAFYGSDGAAATEIALLAAPYEDTPRLDLAAVVADGPVSIDPTGRLSIPNIEALDVDPEVSNTRDSMFQIIGAVQQGHLLVEVDAKTGLSEMLLGRKAKAEVELKSVYGAVIALGTGTDPKTVAKMIPDLQVSQISAAMRSIEADGRLAKANSRVVDFQQSFPITKLWGDGDKASADSMTVDTSPHLYLSRMEYRRKQPGIGIYTHVLGSYSLFYNQPIVLNERQASSAVHGVEHYNATRREDQLKLSLLAVDTHGYTNCAMAVAKLLQFDLCVRLRNLSERMLYLPPSMEELPEALDRLKTGKVSLKKIRQGWDELLRLATSIRTGRWMPSSGTAA